MRNGEPRSTVTIFICSVEYPLHHNPSTIFYKAIHKQREAKEGVGVPGEVSYGAACTFELLEAKEEFQGS